MCAASLSDGLGLADVVAIDGAFKMKVAQHALAYARTHTHTHARARAQVARMCLAKIDVAEMVEAVLAGPVSALDAMCSPRTHARAHRTLNDS